MSTARPPALSQQLARETRERFLVATDEVIAPIAKPIRDRLIAMSDEMTNAREMQDRRDDYLAFQAQGDNWVAETRIAWRKAEEIIINPDRPFIPNLDDMPIPRHELAPEDSTGSDRAIDVQINRLRRKIETDPSNPVYLQTVRGKGYILYSD